MNMRMRLLRVLFLICLVIWIIPAEAVYEGTESVCTIGNAEELITFANDVNGGQTSLSAELTSDIDLSGKQWIPIGNTTNKYIGNFNGNGYEIKNMTIDSTEQYQGFFGTVSGGAVIENLIIDESCSINGGAFSGGLIGGSNGSGTITIQNCGNEANVTSTAQNAAGIIGVNYGSGATYIIKNCYNTGNISGTKESAAISGWLGNNAIVENCYNTGSISGNSTGQAFARFSSVTFTNCYQLDTVGEQSNIIEFTLEAISSGELAYNLGENWGQILGSDNAPIIGGTKVYQGYNGTCKTIYSNNALNTVRPPHDDAYNNKEQCGVCGEWHPESVNVTGLDLTVATEDMSGSTWEWDNTNKKLTLNGLNIEVDLSVGIKLPDGSKIVVADGSENNVTVTNVTEYGILCTGNLTIEGNGKLNVKTNGGDAIRCENSGDDASLTIKNAEVSVSGKINIPSTNKNSSLTIENSTVTTTGSDRNRIEVMSGSESTKTEVIVKNSTVTCGFLKVQDTAKTGKLIFCVENSHLDAEMNETSIMSSAIEISGKDIDVDIENSYVRAYTRCGAWNNGYSYAFRIDGTGNLDLNIIGSDMLLYGMNRGLNVNTSSTMSSSSAIKNNTIISYAKGDDGSISIVDSSGNLTDSTVDDSIVFIYGNTQNSNSTPNYSAEIIGSPTISHDFKLPTSLGVSDIAEVTPDLVLGSGETLTVAGGKTLELLDGVSVKVSNNAIVDGNIGGTVISADNSVGILIFNYGDTTNVVTFNISGEMVDVPQQNPTRLCQVIEGWYDDSEYKVPHDFNKILTSSATVYAKWIDNHNFTDYKSDNNATCTQDGTKTAVCNREECNETNTLLDEGSKIPHTAQAERKNVKEATYEEEGYTGDVVCSCGEILEKGEVIKRKFQIEDTETSEDIKEPILEKSESPKTGDNILIWFVLVFGSGCGLVITMFYNKSKNHVEDLLKN